MSTSQYPHVEAGHQYAEDVVAGRVLACRYVQLACQRYLDDLKRSEDPAYPYVFDARKGERICRFISLLPHTKGVWARGGQRIKLEPWQSFVLMNVFGWVRRSDGLRRFRRVYEEVPRKNAKSVKAAGVGLYMFAADDEAGAEVYSGATTEKQAWEVFRPARLMALRTPDLIEAYGIRVGAKNLSIEATGARFEPLIGDPGDGASPSCAIVDEYHEHKTSRLYDTMLTGMGARTQPLQYVITTAGSDTAGPCYALRQDAIRVLEGTVQDDEFFAIIYTIDEGDDWTTEEALRKANPNYDVSVFGDFLKSQQQAAMRSSRLQNAFKTKHLNVWVGARAAWMNMEEWHRQADAPPLEEFEGEPCWIGLDLASKVDIAAAVKVFRREVDGEDHYYAFGRYYLPEARVEEPDAQHYHGWVRDGRLIATPGEITDYRQIRDDILDDDERYGIAALGYDPDNATHLINELMDLGIECVEVPQRVRYLSEPMKWVEALVKAGRLHHDGCPVLSWMMSNVTVRVDANDNIFPRKERPEAKIDGVVALIMALGRAMADDDGGRSVYEDRGALVFG